ncbi:moz protein represents a chromatin-associated acetyltransferase [Ophiostoma piceae UAMH 11346]|uniref:Moz protein represents a chromatin-associated acetyltransferase n=1 Tax=Ophiostoma piceae (strain UAMH 11346) TaxID=1262450 RepID=S3D9E1_OPHP1|nr:moz protein represents a chromatin-associated acetyltransferase [Ophiostoma piceae UAMH 11346]
MPSARLLALAPAPGQQLFLRGATATAATGGGGDNRAGGASSRAASRSTHRSSSQLHLPQSGGWCRCASTAAVSCSPFLSASSSAQTALFHTRASHRPIPSTNHHNMATRVASFGTATLPKQVAFPRHGKAVEPQEVVGEASREKQSHSAKAGKRATRKVSRRGKTGPSTKIKGDPVIATTATADAVLEATQNVDADAAAEEAEEIEAEAEEAAAKEAAVEEEAADEAEAAEAAEAAMIIPEPRAEPVSPTGLANLTSIDGAPSVSIDAQKELGLGLDAGSSKESAASTQTMYSDNVVELAADAAAAAAAAATAAESASIAAGIVNDSLVIELGPPNHAMATISGPGESDPSSPERQRTEHERVVLPASLRQPLLQRSPPPHLVPPPYVHHFDSYSLVRQLEAGGYKQEQAITAMKGVRLLLAQNLEVAQSSLVSKSDVENEAYLFKAACAELSIEVRNNRRRADEQMRQQRTILQSEVDIAAQSVNQELVALTDVVKGLFNDRKMAVREEQKALESAVQQLNYKITIMLNSEMRSEIEALRWVLIRRSVLGIIFMVMLTLGSLRYVSYVSHEKQKQADRAAREAREAEMQRYADTKFDSSSPPDAAEILAAN